VAAFDLEKDRLRHFRLDRIKRAVALDESFERRADLDPVADVGGWPRTGTVEGSRVAHVWISPEHARWTAEERTVLAELEDGSIVVEWPFMGTRYLVREVLKEAGDAAVLAPADAREAVLAVAEGLLAATP
jgi:proteasome accessory factor BC